MIELLQSAVMLVMLADIALFIRDTETARGAGPQVVDGFYPINRRVLEMSMRQG